MADTRPIIVIKKKKGHGGHHGGAWKVAYADFVTALMALFIVLWLMNTSKDVKEAVAGYFKDPAGTAQKMGTDKTGTGNNFTVTKDDMPHLKEELQKAMRKMANFDALQKQIEMTITSEGLRIELLETEKGTFFDQGSTQPTPNGRALLIMLAQQLGKLPNKIHIEGHTDARPYAGVISVYSNWDLSTDRANVARRLMQENGIGPHQVSQVRGFADQRLRKPDQPEDPSNRRISVVVQYLDSEEKPGEKAQAAPADKQQQTAH